jgi:hypothetical protein
MEEGSRAITFLPEAEPGFIGATLMSLDSAGFELSGKALRVADGQALFLWQLNLRGKDKIPEHDLEPRMTQAAKGILEVRGEPTPFMVLHAATLGMLAEERQLGSFWTGDWTNPLSVLGGKLEGILLNRDVFIRLGRATELERGIYWLVDPRNADDPLSDRVEDMVLGILRERQVIRRSELFEEVYKRFRGFQTPDERFVDYCLQSYALPEPDDQSWRIREEDGLGARGEDIGEVRDLLLEIGSKMGFTLVDGEEILWQDSTGEPQFRFRIQETARLGGALETTAYPLTFVLPGGRAALIMAKIRGDPRLGEWFKSGPRIIKFRHVRRLANETTLTRANLIQRFTIDPPEHHDPQLPLL